MCLSSNFSTYFSALHSPHHIHFHLINFKRSISCNDFTTFIHIIVIVLVVVHNTTWKIRLNSVQKWKRKWPKYQCVHLFFLCSLNINIASTAQRKEERKRGKVPSIYGFCVNFFFLHFMTFHYRQRTKFLMINESLAFCVMFGLCGRRLTRRYSTLSQLKWRQK